MIDPLERLAAILAYLQANGYEDIDADQVTPTTYDETTFDTPGQEWRVLTDEEADEAVVEYVTDSAWAFNASFLAGYMPEGIDAAEIDSIRGDRCEDANAAIVALIKAGGHDMEEFAGDAANADGRGHFLSSYDGDEIEFDHRGRTWFLYRVN